MSRGIVKIEISKRETMCDFPQYRQQQQHESGGSLVLLEYVSHGCVAYLLTIPYILVPGASAIRRSKETDDGAQAEQKR